MSKHTPGPWMANEEGRISAGEIEIGHAFEYELDYSDYCDCHADCTNPPLPRLANARLMAAAPEMLRLIQRLTSPHMAEMEYRMEAFIDAAELMNQLNSDD